MTSKRTRPQTEPATVAIGDTGLGVEHAEKPIRTLLADGDSPVRISVEDNCSGEHVDALFGSLMQSAMAIGGRRLAADWKERLDVLGDAGERAHDAMARTINLNLRFGTLSRRWPNRPGAARKCSPTSSWTPTPSRASRCTPSRPKARSTRCASGS